MDKYDFVKTKFKVGEFHILNNGIAVRMRESYGKMECHPCMYSIQFTCMRESSKDLGLGDTSFCYSSIRNDTLRIVEKLDNISLFLASKIKYENI